MQTNQIPRQVPPPPLVAHPFLLFLSAGVLPFGTLFIELYFMMTSIWLGFFYYLFAFAFLVAVLTVAINIEISILCTYVQLCAEDHGWWWPAFRRGGCVALYVFAYNVAFLFTTLKSVSGFLPVRWGICRGCLLLCARVGGWVSGGVLGWVGWRRWVSPA